MKKYLFFAVFLVISELALAQQNFKYVIIPTQFSEIGKGFNPYGVSSSLQRVLNGKGIASVFEASERPDDYCEALIADIEKTSSLFTNKLLIKLKDCQNNIVWSNEGIGRSKDFSLGYGEAIADALGNLNELPANSSVRNTRTAPVVTPDIIGSDDRDEVYKPKNLYFNDTYFVDLVDVDNGMKKLVIINGKLLGYDKLQEIAILTPADQTGMYMVQWSTPKGETLRGVADLAERNLNITLSSEGKPVVITLIKQ